MENETHIFILMSCYEYGKIEREYYLFIRIILY